MYLYPYEFFCNTILPWIWIFIGIGCLGFICYELNHEYEKDIEVKKLKRIIKQKDKEIKELKSLGNFVYSKYIEDKRK